MDWELRKLSYNINCNGFVILRLFLIKKLHNIYNLLILYYNPVIFNTEMLQKRGLSNFVLIHKPEFHIMIVSGIAH